jgi:hypothetical protein
MSAPSLTCGEHEHSEAVSLAADWLTSQMVTPKPIVPYLIRTFGLTPKQACQATAVSNLRKAQAK